MKAQFEALRTSVLQTRYSRLWRALAPRERLIATGLAVVVAAGLCLWLAQAVDRSRTELRVAVPSLRARADLLEQHAVEFERLRAAPAATPSPTDVRTLVVTQTGAAGLTRALVSAEAADSNQVKIVLGSVAFADWLKLVASFEAQRIHLAACRIDALANPGLVSVTATLVRQQQK